MSDDDAADGISQQGEPNATPVVTNEDDVSTESDLIGDQIPENVTTRRSSGMAGPTLDSSRSALSSLQSARGPAEESDQHESECHKIRHEIDTFLALILLVKVVPTSLLECATSLSHVHHTVTN